MFCRPGRFQKISRAKNWRRSVRSRKPAWLRLPPMDIVGRTMKSCGRRLVWYARMVGVPVLDHCQDYNLVGNGVVHEGYWSTLLGLPGWPAAGEEAIERGTTCHAAHCEDHIHCQHIRSAGSVRLIREARARGTKISGEVCPHHIALTDEAL